MSLIPKPKKMLCDTGKIHCIDCIGRKNCKKYDFEENDFEENEFDVNKENVLTNLYLPKIRVYDKIQDKMIYSGINIINNNNIIFEFENIIEDTNPIQMFGTNLLDKNNVEIFEGDIVSDGVFEYIIKYHFIEGFVKEIDKCWSKLHNHHLLEIVGNIYQNKKE